MSTGCWPCPTGRSAVLRNLQAMLDHGRLGGTGYLSILPVDQGVEHSGGASFAPNPIYFDPANIVELAMEGGCNAVASTLGVLGSRGAQATPTRSRSWSSSTTTRCSPTRTSTTRPCSPASSRPSTWARRRSARPSTSARRDAAARSGDQRGLPQAHELGMVTVLWCYLRNSAFKKDGVDYHSAADLTGQANHLGVTIEADIVKQKQADQRRRLHRHRLRQDQQDRLRRSSPRDHPIDHVRYQVANCYMGRIGIINSGGASGSGDLAEAVRTAVINKRAGGMGLISGRKAFQRPMAEGVEAAATRSRTSTSATT
jgi:class I fructose-bisphosphate aldolase